MYSSGSSDCLRFFFSVFFFSVFFDAVSSSHGGVFGVICSSDFVGDWSHAILLGLGTGLSGFGKWIVAGKDFSLLASSSLCDWGAWFSASFSSLGDWGAWFSASFSSLGVWGYS